MMTTTTYTITVHSHVDPRCNRYDGTRIPRLFMWMFRCDECR